MLSMKKLTPVRLLKNKFYQQVQEAELRGAGVEELKVILGRARAKKGMFEGNLDEGELEIGQVSAIVKDILPAEQIVKNIWEEFTESFVNPLKNSIFNPETESAQTNKTFTDENTSTAP